MKLFRTQNRVADIEDKLTFTKGERVRRDKLGDWD